MSGIMPAENEREAAVTGALSNEDKALFAAGL